MTVSKSEILQALPKLTKKELQDVKAAVDFFLRGTPARQADEFEEALSSALKATLAAHQVWIPKNWLSQQTGTYGKAWHSHLTAIRALLAALQGTPAIPLPAPSQNAVLRHLWALLAADLLERKVPITAGTMVVNMGRIQEVFERAYPGYLRSGLGPRIVSRLTNRR